MLYRQYDDTHSRQTRNSERDRRPVVVSLSDSAVYTHGCNREIGRPVQLPVLITVFTELFVQRAVFGYDNPWVQLYNVANVGERQH